MLKQLRTSLAILLSIALVIAGCGGGTTLAEQVEGNWQQGDIVFTFSADGKVIAADPNHSFEGRYKTIEGDRIQIDMNNTGSIIEWRIESMSNEALSVVMNIGRGPELVQLTRVP